MENEIELPEGEEMEEIPSRILNSINIVRGTLRKHWRSCDLRRKELKNWELDLVVNTVTKGNSNEVNNAANLWELKLDENALQQIPNYVCW